MITKIAALFFFFVFSATVLAQYVGGDFAYSEDSKYLNQQELIEELENIVKVVTITGYRNKQTDCLAYEETKQKTVESLSAIRKALRFLPADYRIVVLGHADKSGVEITEKGTLGNDFYSQKRAESVYNFLLSEIQNVKGRILMGGLGSSSDERKVTFKILPKDEAQKLHNALIKK